MLSKEEIENSKRNAKRVLETDPLTSTIDFQYNDVDNLLEYINQLESDKQKLIEKLKKKIRYFEENDEFIATNITDINDNYSDGTVIKRFIDEFNEILKIVKGEKE